MINMKRMLSAISVASIIWMIFFGNLMDIEPSLMTIAILVVGWAAFSILAILRIVGFMVANLRLRSGK